MSQFHFEVLEDFLILLLQLTHFFLKTLALPFRPLIHIVQVLISLLLVRHFPQSVVVLLAQFLEFVFEL